MKKIIIVILFLILSTLSFFITTNIFYVLVGRPVIFGAYDFLIFFHPFKFILWIFKFSLSGSLYGLPFLTWGFILLGVFITISLAICLKLFYKTGFKTGSLYGSSRWLKNNELSRKGFFAKSGVILGQSDKAKFKQKKDGTYKQLKSGKIIYSTGAEHVAIFAPTRRGKGINTVIPTLFSWLDSVVVYDIKKENFNVTSGWRTTFSNVLCFEPTCIDSVKFNPLMEIQKGDTEISDTQNIVELLTNPYGDGQNDHWKLTAKQLLIGVVLHVLYAEENKTISGVYSFINNPERTIQQTLYLMLETPHINGHPHPTVAETARNMLNKAENELSSVVSTASSFLSLYQDPIVAQNTSMSDFSINDLMRAEHPLSLYLVVSPNDADRLKPLTRLILSQISNKLMRKMDTNNPPKYKLLMLIDEFPTLGKLDFFENNLAFFAGYGIKCCLISQSTEQLFKLYTKDTSILSNCRHKVFLGADNPPEAKFISEFLGSETVSRTSVSKSSKTASVFHSNESTSESEAGRTLMTPDEILRLDFRNVIILLGGDYPYFASKIMYFLDSRFKPRLNAPLSPENQALEVVNLSPPSWDSSHVVNVNKELEFKNNSEAILDVELERGINDIDLTIEPEIIVASDHIKEIQTESDIEESEEEPGFTFTDDMIDL